ncbi:TrkH family potassium uptake protein [Sphingobacterium sp. Mn56C]|uniref:TrkH family potassium uptake protein n=1 Tax=Sphingobacterium sp. Mn56C TaxID=3395261 RepID=UPI003BD540CB
MAAILSFLKYVFRYRSKVVDQVMLYISLLCTFTVIIHVGYITDAAVGHKTQFAILCMFYGLFILEIVRTTSSIYVQRRINFSHYSGLGIIFYFFFISIARVGDLPFMAFIGHNEWLYVGIGLVCLSELSKGSLFFDNFYFNPTILFVISFIGLILVGTILLMLPRTTLMEPLGFLDALFMATSAVCITGLTVTDISTNFSLFGQSVVLLLIQVGGLGIMTFTGFFGYFFSGGFSFKNQLMFGEILGENKLNSVISTLLKIIFITLLFELVGAVFIYFSLEQQLFKNMGDRIFFSVFHAISSFCNSGFSILHDGIRNEGYRYNYSFQLVLSLIFVLGGLGFGTVYNFYTFFRAKISQLTNLLRHKQPFVHKAQPFSFNTKFILLCNAIMIVLATASYFLLEHKHSLNDDSHLSGQWITSFFMANSSRSAGFNSVDMGAVAMPTLIMISTLMWIGASPGSTGGGVKVTTVAVALMNIFSLARGKDSLEVFRRKIATESINKAFAIILLSILTIAIAFVLLNFSDPDKAMKSLLFEAVSAYTTCGLSLGVTPSLSAAGKCVIILTMFVGRVGMLTLLVAFIKNTRSKTYIYPTEKLLF